ncbi:MAG: PrsW family intramembrane metalloprotease [Chloroflexota bacterium]|nr:PrsW family intramembrane metalloprotease [Chloroflexota bacterium]
MRPVLYSVLTIVAACMLICVVLSVVGSTGFRLETIALAIGAALLPTLAYGALILWIDRFEPESWELRGLTFFWGAVIAVFLALIFNTTAFSIFVALSDPDTGAILTAVISAPLVEESAKGLLVLIVLMVTRKHIDGMLDGLVLGALVGLGFAMTENVMYFGQAYDAGGVSSVGALFVVRSLINGLGHAVWASFTGAAIGWARDRHGRGVLRAIVPVIGWGAAVLGHAVWNLGASIVIGVLSVGFERVFWLADWQALILAGLIGGLPFSVPPLLTALIFVLLGREQEERVVRQFLPIEVGLGTLTQAEAATVASPAERRTALREAREMGGKAAWKQQREFNLIATRLAFFHYHAIRGERPYLPEIRRAEQLRWQLSALRWSMLNASTNA